MNNLLSQKNEETFKQNSADFFTLTTYSKDILDLDRYRIKEFDEYSEHIQNDRLKYCDIISFAYANKFKIISAVGISFFLVYKFRSIVILPLFFSSYFVFKPFFNKVVISKENNLCECYFCYKNLHKMKTLSEYEEHYKLIDKVLSRNSKINNLEEFEKELNKLIKEIK